MKVGLRVSGRRAVSVVTAGVLLAATVACTNDAGEDEPQETSPTAATASPEPDPLAELTADERIAVEESLEAFDNLIEGFVDLATTGGFNPSVDLEPVGSLTEFGFPEAATAFEGGATGFLTLNYEGSELAEGTINWELLEVIEVDLDWESPQGEAIPLLDMRLCVDESEWVVVDQETGEVVEDHRQGGRYPATVSAAYSRDDFSDYQQEYAWRIELREDHLDESC